MPLISTDSNDSGSHHHGTARGNGPQHVRQSYKGPTQKPSLPVGNVRTSYQKLTKKELQLATSGTQS